MPILLKCSNMSIQAMTFRTKQAGWPLFFIAFLECSKHSYQLDQVLENFKDSFYFNGITLNTLVYSWIPLHTSEYSCIPRTVLNTLAFPWIPYLTSPRVHASHVPNHASLRPRPHFPVPLLATAARKCSFRRKVFHSFHNILQQNLWCRIPRFRRPSLHYRPPNTEACMLWMELTKSPAKLFPPKESTRKFYCQPN